MVLDLHILNSTTAQSVISVDIPSTQRLVWRLYECIDAILTILLGVVYLSRNVGETSYSLLVPIIGMLLCIYVFYDVLTLNRLRHCVVYFLCVC